jgi:hypothetical protein
MTISMDTEDQKVLEKIEEQVLDGLDDTNAVRFLAKLTVEEYERLIQIFSQAEQIELPEGIRLRLIEILQKLKAVKEGAVSG